QGQFPQCGAACLGSGVQGQVDPGGAGEQGGAQDGVVGQPGVGLQRHLAGQDQFLAWDRDQCSSQRVTTGQLAEPGRVTGAGGLEGEPVAAALERVGGQVDAARLERGVEGVPVDVGAAGVGTAYRCHQCSCLRVFSTAGGRETG